MDTRMKNHMACQKALIELNEKYYPKFREILTPMQTAQFLELWGNSFNQRQGAPSQQGAQRERRNRN